MKPLSRILHVEDDPDIREVSKLAFDTFGDFEVRQCADGDEAMRVAPSFDADLYLLDVMMPGRSGLEVYRDLCRINGETPVPAIFMTAKINQEDIARYRAAGAIGVIEKPFDVVTISDQIRQIWRDR
jgi:two-component system OmpR family response regulator